MSSRDIRRTGGGTRVKSGIDRTNPVPGIFVDVPIEGPRGTQVIVEVEDVDFPIRLIVLFVLLTLSDAHGRYQILKIEHRRQSRIITILIVSNQPGGEEAEQTVVRLMLIISEKECIE